MLTLALFVLLQVAPGAGPSVEDARAQAASTTSAEAEIARRFAELAARTNALASFTASYRTKVGEADLVITLAYEAPSRARLQWHGPGMNVDTWVIDGHMSIRGDYGQGPVHADVPLPEIVTLGPAFESALRELTGASAGAPHTNGPGPIFAIEVVADSSKPDGRSMRCQLGWEPHRAHVLTWLATPEDWNGARREDDRIVRDGPAGSALALSLSSGFFAWIRMKATLRLEDLRVDKGVPAETFVVPAAAREARDISADTRQEQDQLTAVAARRLVYAQASKANRATAADVARRDEKLERVFGALHTELQKRALGPWRARTSTQIDEFLAKWSADARRAGVGTPTRQALDRAASDWRTSIVKVLADTADTCAEGLDAPRGIAGDPAAVESIRAVEQEVVRAVFARETTATLLARFDAGVRAAREQ
ncbi:MAG: hypothetical protein NTY35_02425 [Planctomycetota bacterium]|nr:hypothetical protein [Planctomycetota bacterium]